ncbi:hypothetical protein HDV00_011526 [Rhizophlyctis rosea]|nr:hypothetical protein HDV00_011526 [Rhizophlyctis rosea]
MFGFDGFKQARKRAAHAKYLQLRKDYIESVLNLKGYDDRGIAAAYRIFDQDMKELRQSNKKRSAYPPCCSAQCNAFSLELSTENKDLQDFANHLARHGAWAVPGVNKKIKTKAAKIVELHTEGGNKRKEVVGTHASDWLEVIDLTGEDS